MVFLVGCCGGARRFDVGGRSFVTTKPTLLSEGARTNNFLSQLDSDDFLLEEGMMMDGGSAGSGGVFFIDRDPTLFSESIMDQPRLGNVSPKLFKDQKILSMMNIQLADTLHDE